MTEQQTAWPSHYTAADVALIEKCQQWIVDRSYTQAALARLARISSSSLNQIIKGVYRPQAVQVVADGTPRLSAGKQQSRTLSGIAALEDFKRGG